MKTNRIIAIATFVSIMFMTAITTQLAASEITISLRKAMGKAELVKALQEQADPADFLKSGDLEFYIVDIKFNGDLFHVFATREEWAKFYNNEGPTSSMGGNDDGYSDYLKRKKVKESLTDRQ
nr:hypothetical protein [Bacteroidota bacterium]